MNTARTLGLTAAGLAATGIFAFVGVQATAVTRPSEKQRAAVLQAIVDCRPLTESAARLACFDAAAAKLDEAEASGQIVVVDRDQARQVRREVFGLQLPSLDIFGRAGGKAALGEDVDRLTATVASFGQQGDGRWVITLDSGAVWRQVDDSRLYQPPRVGSKAEIRRAALGSFFMKIDSQPPIRVHRDR